VVLTGIRSFAPNRGMNAFWLIAQYERIGLVIRCWFGENAEPLHCEDSPVSLGFGMCGKMWRTSRI
jgi:hypothetical protein